MLPRRALAMPRPARRWGRARGRGGAARAAPAGAPAWRRQPPAGRRTCGSVADLRDRSIHEELPLRVFSALRLATLSEPELREAFWQADADGSGLLSAAEVSRLMRQTGLRRELADASAAALLQRFDRDGDGCISFPEFHSGVLELEAQRRAAVRMASDSDPKRLDWVWAALRLHSFSEEELRAAFDELDADGSGRLTPEEVSSLLQRDQVGLPAAQASSEAQELMRKFDADRDGHVSFREFHAGVLELASRRDPRIWPLSGTMLCGGLAVGVAAPALPLLGLELGLSQAEFGYTVSALGAATMLANLPCAMLVEERGRRPLVLGGLCLQGLGLVGAGASWCLPAFVAARLGSGLGVSAMATGCSMAVADLSTPLNRARVGAIAGAAFSFGKVIGPAAGGALVAHLGPAPALLSAGGVFFATALYTRAAVAESKPSLEPAAAERAVPIGRTALHSVAQWRELLRHGELRSLMLVNCVSLAAHAGASYTLMPLMLAGGELRLSPEQVGCVFSLQALVSVASAGPTAALVDRVGAGRTIAPAVAASAASMVLFPLAGDLWQVGAVVSAWAASRTVLNLAPAALVANAVAPEARAQSLAMLRTTGDLGFFVGASSLGLAGAVLGADAAMRGAGLASCAAAALFAARRAPRGAAAVPPRPP